MQNSNKKKQQASKSAKKQKNITIKNVLASPFANYWPSLTPEDNNAVAELLTNSLPRLARVKVDVPWKEIKNIPREERKTFRKEFTKGKIGSQPENTERSDIVLGINQVTVALEEKSLNAVIIASDVQPRYMVKHVIDMSVLYSVPVLVVTDLRKILQVSCGVTSLVAGLRNTIKADTKLYLVQQSIKRISENYPVPKDHINFNRRADINEEDSSDFSDALKTQREDVCTDDNSDNSKTTAVSANREDASHNEISDDELLKRIYLVKKSPDAVAFTPKFSGCGSTQRADRMDVDSAGFLGFSAETPVKKQVPQTSQSNPSTGHKVNYKSLILKRLKGNGDRNKKNIDRLKRRKK